MEFATLMIHAVTQIMILADMASEAGYIQEVQASLKCYA